MNDLEKQYHNLKNELKREKRKNKMNKLKKWYYNIKSWIIQKTNTSFVSKCIVGIIIWIIALVPTWLYILTRWLSNPETFWMEFALLGLFIICIGWAQIATIIIG